MPQVFPGSEASLGANSVHISQGIRVRSLRSLLCDRVGIDILLEAHGDCLDLRLSGQRSYSERELESMTVCSKAAVPPGHQAGSSPKAPERDHLQVARPFLWSVKGDITVSWQRNHFKRLDIDF